MYRKHRSMLNALKSRAEKVRASSVGLELLASRDASFQTAQLVDDGLLSQYSALPELPIEVVGVFNWRSLNWN